MVHLLDSLNVVKADVVGAATGSCIAVEMAVRWPARVRRLVLVGLPFWLSAEERLARLNEVKKQTLETPARICEDFLARMPRGTNGEISEDDLEYASSCTLDTRKAGSRWKETHIAVFRYDPSPRLPLIQAPTLVVGVTEGTSQYTKRAREVKALIPRSSLFIMEGADWRVKYTRANELAENILLFLDETTR
jgi:pimeloyl-ACP methyl ester carboxylesterase